MRVSFLLTFFMIILGSTALTPVQAQDELVYVAVEPCRIVDTRNAGGVITANSFRIFRISGTLGELASQGGMSDCLDPKAGTGQEPSAIVAYVVAVPTANSGPGVLTAYPSNLAPPPAGSGSTVNFSAQQIIGNTTTITLCDPNGACPTEGEFAILARNTEQHVVIDVQGYFYPARVPSYEKSQVVGFTAATFRGGSGVVRFTNACQQEYTGSHMCTTEEFLNSDSYPSDLPVGGEAWIRPVIITAHLNNSDISVDYSGLSDFTTQMSCMVTGWEPSTAGLTVSSVGTITNSSCSSVLPVSCCRVQ